MSESRVALHSVLNGPFVRVRRGSLLGPVRACSCYPMLLHARSCRALCASPVWLTTYPMLLHAQGLFACPMSLHVRSCGAICANPVWFTTWSCWACLGSCTSVFKGVCRYFGVIARSSFLFENSKMLSHSPCAFKHRGAGRRDWLKTKLRVRLLMLSLCGRIKQPLDEPAAINNGFKQVGHRPFAFKMRVLPHLFQRAIV